MRKRVYILRKDFINQQIKDLLSRKRILKDDLDKDLEQMEFSDVTAMAKKIEGQSEMLKMFMRCRESQAELRNDLRLMKRTVEKYGPAYSSVEIPRINDYVIDAYDQVVNAMKKESSSLKAEFNKKAYGIEILHHTLNEEIEDVLQKQKDFFNDNADNNDNNNDDDNDDDVDDTLNVIEFAKRHRSCAVCMDNKPEYDFVWSSDCPHSLCRKCVVRSRTINRMCVVCRVEQSDTFIMLDSSAKIMQFKTVIIEGSLRNQLEDEAFTYDTVERETDTEESESENTPIEIE